MRVFIGYQDIDSGAKVATEQLLESFKKNAPHSQFIVYKQPPYRFGGVFAFTRNFLWSVLDFIKILNKTEGDLTAIYSPYYLVYVAKLFSKHRRIPFYFHLHGNQAETKIPSEKKSYFDPRYLYTVFINQVITFLQKTTLQQAHQVFFVSKKAKENFLKQYRTSLPADKSAIIPNGISTAKFFPVSNFVRKIKKKKLIKNTLGLVLLYVGRIDHKKGILELVKSLSWLKTSQLIHLIVIYPDIPDKYSQQYLNTLENEARQNRAKVFFLKNPSNLVEYYQIADLVILPSYQEMMPLVMLEAFACGVPFIGSKAGNMPEVLQKINGNLILQKISPQSIAEKINWFLKRTAKQREKIITAEKKVAHRSAWNNSACAIIRQLTLLE